MTQHFVAFDAETIPRDDLPEACLPVFDPETVNIPSNWGEEARAKKIAAERARFEKTLDKKLGVSPELCRPCSICFYDSKRDELLELFAKDREEEVALVNCAWEAIERAYFEGIPIVSYNGKTFDLQVLHRRAMLLDARRVSPSMYHRLVDMRLENRAHIDLEISLGIRVPFSSRPIIKSFEFWLAYFGIGAKPEGWDGSKVWPAFQEKWFEDIQAYNRIDVELLSALFRRVEPWVLEEPARHQVTRDSESLDQVKAA
jgi:hypothetical protein